MIKSRNWLSALCVFFLLHPLAIHAAGQPPKINSSGVQMPVSQKLNLVWPGEVDREALVLVRICVNLDGRTSDVEVIGGFYEKRFVDAAVQALRAARYKPAMKNGVAIDHFCVVQPCVYTLGESAKGITDEFRFEMNKVEKLIKKGDNAGAHFHAQWMLSEKAKLLYEYAALQSELAYTHASVGNIHRAIEAAHAGSQRKSPTAREFSLDNLAPPNDPRYYMLPRDVVTGLLDMRFRLAAKQGMYLEAIEAYQELAGLKPIPADDPRVTAVNLIVASLKSDDPLVAKLRIGDAGTVEHKLFRRTLSIIPRSGEIEAIALNCAGHGQVMPYQPNVDWTLPAAWQECSVFVRGAVDSQFDLVEYTAPQSAAGQLQQ